MLTRLPWRRGPADAAADPPFDALIDVDPSFGAPAGAGPAVQAIPGARWVSLESHRNPAGITVRLFPSGSGLEAAWPDLRRRVEAAVRAALPQPVQRRVWTPIPPVPARGFAEVLSPSQFDALAQLAALAAHTAAAPPGPPALNEAELTARLLGFVLPADPGQAAAAALRRFGSYAAILAAPEAELRQVPGLGTHSVAAIKLVHAAAIRLARAAVARGPVLDSPARLAEYLAIALARERVEQFRILFLDEAGMLKADEVQATGTVNHTPVYPREVVRRALQLQAAALVLVHNHPSGDPEPSREDVEMTRQVRQAADTMGIGVRDHIIVGAGRWSSFRELGLL
ncbi:MAG: RadC family protein [Janthinobacterium lividum]